MEVLWSVAILLISATRVIIRTLSRFPRLKYPAIGLLSFCSFVQDLYSSFVSFLLSVRLAPLLFWHSCHKVRKNDCSLIRNVDSVVINWDNHTLSSSYINDRDIVELVKVDSHRTISNIVLHIISY